MRSKLSLDQDADASQLTALHPPVLWRKEKDGALSAYFPKGSEFTGAQALSLCQTGQATPADDECANALGMTETIWASTVLRTGRCSALELSRVTMPNWGIFPGRIGKPIRRRNWKTKLMRMMIDVCNFEAEETPVLSV